MIVRNLVRLLSSALPAAVLLALPHTVQAQPGAVAYASESPAKSSAYPKGDFAAHLTAATGGDGSSCGGGACDWGWGCGGSPFRTGPGPCDDWRVGPRWRGSVGAIVLFRESIDLVGLAAESMAGGAAIPLGADTVTENFDHGIGGRLRLINDFSEQRGYSVEVNYVGIPEWNASAYSPERPPAGPVIPGVTQQRSLEYTSYMHSVEVNMLRQSDSVVEAYGGARYIRLAEDVDDFLNRAESFPALPPNAPVPDPVLDVRDLLRHVGVANNLIGIQGGLRSDLFQVTPRLRFEGFLNGGAYCNLIYRDSRIDETRRVVALDDPSTPDSEAIEVTQSSQVGYESDRARIAYTAEASFAAALQWNRCLSTKLGYQVLYLDGLELGASAFRGIPPSSEDLLLHGFFASLEYRR
ncbi:hypothetical protein Pla175_18360 [Pirellulimonas nuda]|uniref:Uncharacterized protein n=1 Tax=Pirellulimonas nuda TaxID=2528009 RepID=A0A518DAH6_9BACT|nr:hypothetical protein [Pirellulimonas nuda]QDU88458.1 hypothetical protein Pla175_18360 [Pirellulimonas nuda]